LTSTSVIEPAHESESFQSITLRRGFGFRDRAWAYCPEQWRLQSLGNALENLAALERGWCVTREIAAVEVSLATSVSPELVLIVLAVLLVLVAIIFGGEHGTEPFRHCSLPRLLGLIIAALAFRSRRARASAMAKTVALDDVTLFSKRLRPRRRPDRLVKVRGLPIPEEWKSSKTIQSWHVLQLGTYFILIEEEYGVRPPYGFVVFGNGARERVANTQELRGRVLKIASEIREARRRVEKEIRVSPQAWQCRVCGSRSKCRQSRA